MSESCQTQRQGIVPFSLHFQATRPLPGRGILMAGGKINIAIRKTAVSNAVNVAAKIGSFGSPLMLHDDFANVAPADRLTFNAGTGMFTGQATVQNLPTTQPRANNQRILIKAYNNANAAIESETFAFIVIPSAVPVSVRVPAKGCLFFAYTPFDVVLPKGEKLLDSLPCFVPAPIDATTVGITVPAGQTWNNEHGAFGPDGGPAGPQPDNDTTIDAYFSPALGSENMKRLNKTPQPVGVFLDGLLTAMWDYGPENASHPTACAQMPIGANPPASHNIVNIGTSAEPIMPVHLLFGLHTDDDWSTQSGSLEVKLTWN